ncbi:hypothetical protein BDY19DRAFT_883102 [Irpex rosettiformis]|uniref:Uncharacterized protein n=1 Tax=Irpex rosettiformis TaxID=378272 RepID=A0ACB8UFG8_9APHY|nr:hypothetical protein BDY19DRAFT_883102 [Irpex rosettiformis]
MATQTERRVMWHPRLDNRFVVGNPSQVTLYQWLSESSEIKHVTSSHVQDAITMKCMAWSPDPSYDDLIALGLSTGKVELTRLEGTRSATSQSWAKPLVSLNVKNSRSCNTLAFCSADHNYLAVGLEKARGDYSLVVWDIVSAAPNLSIKPSSQLTFSVPPSNAPSRPEPAIARAEPAPKHDGRILQQHAHSEAVSSLAFLPQSTTLLLAGISYRWLRLFDLRTPQPTVHTASCKVQGIATDPFDSHRIGCFGDGIVTIWDARRMTHPLLTFTEKDASADGAMVRPNSAFANIEFSPTRRGVLATLERDANNVRFWDLQQFDVVNRSPERSRSRDSTQSHRAPRLSWANPTNILQWSGSGSGQIPSVRNDMDGSRSQVVLAGTKRTKYFSRTIASFALVPPSNAETTLTTNVMVVTKEGDLELYAVHDTATHTPWSARGDLAIGLGRSYTVIHGIHELEPPPEPWELTASSYAHSTPRSIQKPLLHEDIPSRGRHGAPNPATFGRGDDDGFPALGSAVRKANLSATRPGTRSRALSPVAWKNKFFDHTGVTKRNLASLSPGRSDTGSKGRHKSLTMRHWSHSESVQHSVETDISITMRKRVVQGYGLVNPSHNSSVVFDVGSDLALSQIWMWIDHARELLSLHSSLLEGYNFSYQGILGIWEGFRPTRPQITAPHPTPRLPQRSLLLDTPQTSLSSLLSEIQHTRSRSLQPNDRNTRILSDEPVEEFSSVVESLLTENDLERTPWKPAVSTNKPAQRRLALDLCGWSLAEEDLNRAVKRWEKEHRYSQAACWLVFTKKYKSAIDLLMRSKDESHHMMSGMLAALNPSAGSGNGLRNAELRDHCERLIIRLQDPYLRAMLTHLTVSDDWTEVLQEDTLPLRERLAIAFQFLGDAELTAYLRRIVQRGVHDGDIETLLVSGLTPQGMDILQAYLDTSGDVQTVALFAALDPTRARDKRVVRWLDTYRDLLDSWKLFHYRCQLDIDRGRLLNDAIQQGEIASFKWTKPEIILRCNYCNKALTPPWPNNAKATSCFFCGRSLPRCSICLMTLSIVNDSARNAELNHSHPKDTIDEALVFCQTCRHGGHSSHILEWFFGDDDGRRAHEVCPVASCDCRCADEM